jgi:hypothetical protein
MHRTHLSGLLGVVLIPAMAIGWPLGMLVALGIIATRSLTGAFGALVGLVIWHPTLAVPAMLAGGAAVWLRHRFPPGAIVDTTRARLISWIYLLREFQWLGHGAGSARLALEAAWVVSDKRAMDGGPARNEFLELVHEYGVLALLGFAVAAWVAAPHLHWGDPTTATAASIVAVCSVTSPLRAVWRWLHGDRESLFGPPLKVSISVHVNTRGEVMIYGARDLDGTRESTVMVAQALVLAMTAWHDAYDVSPAEVLQGVLHDE